MNPRIQSSPAGHMLSDADLRIELMLAAVNDPNPRAHCRLGHRDASLVLMVRAVTALALLKMGARMAPIEELVRGGV